MMRTFIVSIAAAASALAIASPASAQWAPPPQQYGYGNQGYGYGYGYGNPGYDQGYGYNHAGSLHARVRQLQQRINDFDRRNILTRVEANQLRNSARQIERRLALASRNGLSQREAYNINHRIAVVEARFRAEARDGRGGWNRYDRDDRGYDGRRDRDDDRWDDDRDDDRRGRGRGRGWDRD